MVFAGWVLIKSQLTEIRKSFPDKALSDFRDTDLGQILAKIDEHPELVAVFAKWEGLSDELRGAVLRLVDV